MKPEEYLTSLDADGSAFAVAAEGNLTAPVTACPGWTVADLVHHLGRVHRFWATVVRDRMTEMDRASMIDPARPDDEDLPAWYRDGLTELQLTLAATDPATTVWTWSPQQNVAFVQRRMAQETAVHRWDAQLAAHAPEPIGAALAIDGIDEFLSYHLADEGADEEERISGSVHMHVTGADVSGGEWMVRFDGRSPVVSHAHEKGDVALRGTGSDLLLALWRRVPLADLDVIGDGNVAARFLGVADLD